MNEQEIYDYLINFFNAFKCDVKSHNNNYLEVKLTEEIDKEIMNRPFYWHYLKATGGAPETKLLKISTKKTNDPKNECEIINFGTPRLHQLFDVTKKHAKYIRMYEDCQGEKYPWLSMNMTVSYKSALQKGNFLSLGLNLITGEIRRSFFEQITQLNLVPKISELSYTLHPFITLKSGIKRLEKMVRQLVELDTTKNEWIKAAHSAMKNELALLDNFFTDKTCQYYQKEKETIINLHTPKVEVNIINGGIFYLSKNAFLNF